MKLYLFTDNEKRELCEFPENLVTSKRGLEMFFRRYAERVLGPEGSGIYGSRNWHIVETPRCVVPMHVQAAIGGGRLMVE